MAASSSTRIPELWNHPKADAALRKRLLLAAIFEIVVTHRPEKRELEAIIHWQGEAHTRVVVYTRARLTPRVPNFRHHHHVPIAPSSIDDDVVTDNQAADYLGISRNALLAPLPARSDQCCFVREAPS